VRAGLDALGQVRFVVPASTLHGHLFMEQYAAAYPDAQLFAVPGLRQKRPDLRFAADLDDRPDPRWAAEIDQVVFRGHRMLEEVVFLHRRTRSLIVGDTFFNVEPDAPLLLRLWAWGPRLRRSAGPTPLFRRAIRDRAAARRSVERILQWDFERIVTGHGAIVEGDGKETWRRAWSWV
jgi:Domain of unknown function (DUF4336)